MGLKQHSNLFLATKSKGNLSKYRENKKAFERIKSLGLINHQKYLELHPDCKNEELEVELHYIYYGFKDKEKPYISPLFDSNFYKNSYECDDPIIDYVLNGFFKENLINPLDDVYIDTLEENIETQFYKHQNSKIQLDIDNFNLIRDKKTTIPYIESNKTFENSKIRVGVFIKDPVYELAPCPYIRIYNPLKELAKSDKYTFFFYGTGEFPLMDLDNILKEKQFDIIVVQRILPFLDILLKRAKEHNIKIVYETDDDMLGVEENSPSFSYVEKYRNSTEEFIENADVVTVSTPTLAAKFPDNNVKIIRNYLVDFLTIKNNISDNKKIKLGYYGTLTHSKDIVLLKNVIKKLKESYDFDFEIVGGFNQEDYIEDDWYNLVPLPDNPDDFENFMKWLYDYVDWDIGLVPLEDSNFNSCKSELKFIELTAMGIPGIYSDINVYSSVVEDGYNGLLANGEKEWFLKIETLINNKKLRETLQKNAAKTVANNYLLEDRVKQWDNILFNLYNKL